MPRATVGKWSRNDSPTAEYEAVAIAAAVITDEDGRVLLVRKFRTLFFMQPGGKLGPGETAIEALKRELIEELGCLVAKAEFLGFFAAPAANEPTHRAEAALFQVFVSGQLEPRAEIEEIAWVDPATNCGLPLARDHVFPLVLLRRSGQNELLRRVPSGR